MCRQVGHYECSTGLEESDVLSKNALIMAKILLLCPRRTVYNSCTQKRNGNQTVSKLHLSKIVFCLFLQFVFLMFVE